MISNLLYSECFEQNFLGLEFCWTLNFLGFKTRIFKQAGSKCFVLCFEQSSIKISFFQSSVIQNAFYFVLLKARWRFISLKQISGSKFPVLCFHKIRWRYISSNQMRDSNCFVLCFVQSSMNILVFELNVWFTIFCNLFCTKLDEDKFSWIECVIQNVLYSVLHKTWWRYVESNVCFNMVCTLFCTKLDKDLDRMSKMMVFSKWWRCVFQNVFCSVLHKPRWRYVSLYQMCGSKSFVLCFAQNSKIRFIESNMWCKMFCNLFFANFDEDTFLWIKCLNVLLCLSGFFLFSVSFFVCLRV